MTIKGRSVTIIAAGIWICVSGPSLAAQDGETNSAEATKIEGSAAAEKPAALKKYAGHSRRHWKKHASARKFGKVAGKSPRHKEIAAAGVMAMADDEVGTPLPANIANANAAVPTPDTTVEAADDRLVSADQLNDVDRALTETSAPAPLLTLAAASTPITIGAAPATVSTAASSEDTAWSKSSVIGKIFIAFGGLLTLASAARMFIA